MDSSFMEKMLASEMKEVKGGNYLADTCVCESGGAAARVVIVITQEEEEPIFMV